MAGCVVVEEVFVEDELVHVFFGVFWVPEGGGDEFVAAADDGEDVVGRRGCEAEDGVECVEGVEGGNGVVEKEVVFAGEVRGGLDQGAAADVVWVNGAFCEGGERVV